MARSRPRQPGPARRLSEFAAEKQVLATDTSWPRLTEWQRKGWVSLRWGDSGSFCFVSLTQSGRDEDARLSKAGGSSQ
jgi:hypothetical protein